MGEVHINPEDDSTAIWPSCKHWLRRSQLSFYETFLLHEAAAESVTCILKARSQKPSDAVRQAHGESQVVAMDGAMQQRSSLPPWARPSSLPMFLGSRLQTSAHSGKPLVVNQVGMTQPAMSPHIGNWLGFGDFSGCDRSGKQGEEELEGWLAGVGGSSHVLKKGDFCSRGSGDGEQLLSR